MEGAEARHLKHRKPISYSAFLVADGKYPEKGTDLFSPLLSRRDSTLSHHPPNAQKSPRSLDLRLFHFISGAPGGIRTHDPCLRRAVLYPAELRMLVRATSYPCRPDASIPAFSPPPVVHFRQKMANRHPHSQLPAPHVPLFALLLWLYTASTPQFLR